MVNLSVNVNKIALLRNARNINIPSVLHFARLTVEAGAQGVTVHPRPDERHIRRGDVREIFAMLNDFPDIEFNIEGNPFLPPFMDIIGEVKPEQCTLVPDSVESFTSDHGWDLNAENEQRLTPLIKRMHDLGCRVSLFMDAGSRQIERAAELGADRIELYTEPYAAAPAGPQRDEVFAAYTATAKEAAEVGLGVNAGHDLNLENLPQFCTIPNLLEVSIGHALVSDALEMGFTAAVRAYLRAIGRQETPDRFGS